MEKGIKNLAMLFAVVYLAMLWRIVHLQDELVEVRHDLVSIEMEYKRLERRAQFYLEEYQDVADHTVEVYATDDSY